MSAETPEKPDCGVCKGKYKEHFDEEGKPTTQHVYTPNPGDLVSHEEMKKRQTQQPQRFPLTPGMLAGAANATPDAIGRLTEVLLDLKVIGVEHALYVAGMGSKPTAPSGYQDPMRSL